MLRFLRGDGFDLKAAKETQTEAALCTLLCVKVAGSGRSLFLVEPQQGEHRQDRLCVTHEDGGGFRRLVCRPE